MFEEENMCRGWAMRGWNHSVQLCKLGETLGFLPTAFGYMGWLGVRCHLGGCLSSLVLISCYVEYSPAKQGVVGFSDFPSVGGKRICGIIRAEPGETIEMEARGWIQNCTGAGGWKVVWSGTVSKCYEIALFCE